MMSDMKLILPKNIKVYVCTPWDIRNGSINDNADYAELVKLTSSIDKDSSLPDDKKDNEKGLAAKLSIKLHYAHYCPAIVIDYATGLFASNINYGFYTNNKDFFNNAIKNCQCAYEILQYIMKSIYPNSECNRYCSDNLILDNLDYVDWICSDGEDTQVYHKYAPLSTTIMSHIMSGKDKANQLLNDNDNVEIVEWDWNYDNLKNAITGSRTGSVSLDTQESNDLKNKIKDDYKNICEECANKPVSIPVEISTSVDPTKNLAESLYQISLNTNDLEALTIIQNRMVSLKNDINKVSALSKVLELDAKFSGTKHGLESSIDTLSSLLDMRTSLS